MRLMPEFEMRRGFLRYEKAEVRHEHQWSSRHMCDKIMKLRTIK